MLIAVMAMGFTACNKAPDAPRPVAKPLVDTKPAVSPEWPPDPCDSVGGTATEVRLELKRSDLNEAGAFVGTFEIENTSRKDSISLGLVGEKAGEFAFVPDTSIEYLDLSSDWKRILALPASYRLGVTHMQVLQPRGKYVFKAMLVSAETARLNSREFRFLLRTYNPRLCVFSIPFHGVPSPPPVQRLQTSRESAGCGRSGEAASEYRNRRCLTN